MAQYQHVSLEQIPENSVTVGIEQGAGGVLVGTVWWDGKAGVEPEEHEFLEPVQAFDKAEAAKSLHGFDRVVVVLQDPTLWDMSWGDLLPETNAPAPHLTSDETEELARAIETERDA